MPSGPITEHRTQPANGPAPIWRTDRHPSPRPRKVVANKAKIKQIVDQYNLTTIMVTHDPEEACTMSDRVLILNQGRIAQYDTPENIIEHPASDFVRDFILHQLEVKRNNIYSLFSEDHAADPADPARREPALVRA